MGCFARLIRPRSAWLAAQCAETEQALDIGAGSAQVALPLTSLFNKVLTGDASPSQPMVSKNEQRVHRFACLADHLPVIAGQLDLIEDLQPELLRRRGDPEQQRTVRWPLHILAGYPHR